MHIIGTASEYKTTAIARIVCSSTAEYMPSIHKTGFESELRNRNQKV